MTKRLLAIYVTLLAIGSMQAGRFGLRHWGYTHRWMHGVIFAALAALGSLTARQRGAAARALVALSAAVFLGAAIELGQHWVYHNPYEWEDVRDDALGASAGAALSLAFLAARDRDGQRKGFR